MSSNTAITVENIGKRYSLHHKRKGEQYTALRDVIARQCLAPFKVIGKKMRIWKGLNRSHAHDSPPYLPNNSVEEFWALRNISFEVKQGDVLAIIGRNGAGKSTLLKILSRITDPSEGRVRLRGRVASLLEVGTGFHPELTGRENIFLNGSILGMNCCEIKAKFDEIVAFAGVETFLDTPVKRYSSGMYVRLAFAVAAHLEPEILIVDEVLSVGDAEFQKKCLGKMHDVATSGRTVLFVSHNIQAVSLLCSRGVLLTAGSLTYAGSIQETIDRYVSTFSKASDSHELPDRRPGSGEYRFTRASPAREYFGGAEEKIIYFEIERRSVPTGRLWLSALVVDSSGMTVAQCDSRLVRPLFGDFKSLSGQFRLRSPWLKPGSYRMDFFICATGLGIVDGWEGACSLNISPVLPYQNSVSEDGVAGGVVFSDFAWQTAEPTEQPEFPLSGSPLRVVQTKGICRLSQ
jgi:lipopolysaccharide transport system ATP-binding protein